MTRYEWLLTQLNEHEAQALKIEHDSETTRLTWTLDQTITKEDKSVSNLLVCGFQWSTSKADCGYWANVYAKYAQREIGYAI